jgi:predicted transposase YbfD/YdcC
METKLHEYFRQLPDPRINRNKKHLLIDIIIISVLAVICGAESWDSIEMFGRTKIDFLKKILRLPNGIPSHDTINRVFSMLRPDRFEQIFTQWVDSLRIKGISNEVIAIDGKTVRGSKDTFHEKSPIHIVSAWANSNQLVLGQRKVDAKSNEITAIPLLLEVLDVEGCIITIDAMGTQKEIAKTIIDNKAGYILALKGNQGSLNEEVGHLFSRQKPDSENTTIEKGHGRIETRNCQVINNLAFLDDKDQWKNLTSIIRVESQRDIRGKITNETRLYISSIKEDANNFNTFIRQHWGIENSLHWTLDVTFNEDHQRKRNGMAAQNFAIVQKIVLNLLKTENSQKASLRNKRLKAGWDNDFLLKILKI